MRLLLCRPLLRYLSSLLHNVPLTFPITHSHTQVTTAFETSGFLVKMASEPSSSIPTKDLSQVVQGTAENLLNKLEENLDANKGEIPEDQLLQSSQPGPLDKDGKNVEDVLNIISQSIFREGEGHILLKLCDRPSLLSVVSHSLSAYITTLEPIALQRLSARIASEVSLWMCTLFHFDNGAAFCHDDTREGLVKIARMALLKHYPKMATDGFEALYSRPPIIYLTSNTYVEIGHYVCLQLGLPLSSIKVLRPDLDNEEALEAIFNEDKAAGKLAIACIANVHSSLFQGFSPTKLEAVCKKNNVWLHLEGHALAALSLLADGATNVPNADSLSLTIGSWIGVPAVPFVTLYKIVGHEEIANYAGLATVNPSVRLNCLPLWCVLRSLGEDQFKSRINNIFEIMEVLNSKMSEFTCIRILSQRPEHKEFVNVQDVCKADFDVDQVYKTVSPALAFQYVSNSPPDPNERVPDYFNNLNSWLGQTMQRDCSQVTFGQNFQNALDFVVRFDLMSQLSLALQHANDSCFRFRWRLWMLKPLDMCSDFALLKAWPFLESV